MALWRVQSEIVGIGMGEMQLQGAGMGRAFWTQGPNMENIMDFIFKVSFIIL